MANEISLSITLTYTNPAQNIAANSLGSGAAQVSIITSAAYERNVQAATTTKTNLPLALLTTWGYVLLHNCDAVNSINIHRSTSDTNPMTTLKPGEWQLFRFATTTTPAIASTAGTPLLEYFAIDN